jgi:hypothetical protein
MGKVDAKNRRTTDEAVKEQPKVDECDKFWAGIQKQSKNKIVCSKTKIIVKINTVNNSTYNYKRC